MPRKTKKQILTQEGWERQFIASEPRLSESVELYKSLGYDVMLEPVNVSCLDHECKACLDSEKDMIIFTRKKRD